MVIPDHTAEKLDALAEHYLMPVDMILQKIMVDRADEIHEVVILEPKRKQVAQ